MLAGFGGEVDQVSPEGWPGGFVGEVGQVLVDAIKFGQGSWSQKLFGGDVEAIGVALHSVEEAGGWVVELPKQAAGGDRRLIAGEDLLQGLGRRTGRAAVRAEEAVRGASADDLEVEMVGVSAPGEHGIQLLAR